MGGGSLLQLIESHWQEDESYTFGTLLTRKESLTAANRTLSVDELSARAYATQLVDALDVRTSF